MLNNNNNNNAQVTYVDVGNLQCQVRGDYVESSGDLLAHAIDQFVASLLKPLGPYNSLTAMQKLCSFFHGGQKSPWKA